MPRTRSLETYPNREFWALVQAILAEGTKLVPCTRAQAASIRGEIYAWRRACEASAERAAALGIDVLRTREVAFRIDDQGLTGILASELQTAKLINAALGGETPPLQSAAQQSLAKFLEGLTAPKEPDNG